jgi:hypothetical protein
MFCQWEVDPFFGLLRQPNKVHGSGTSFYGLENGQMFAIGVLVVYCNTVAS